MVDSADFGRARDPSWERAPIPSITRIPPTATFSAQPHPNARPGRLSAQESGALIWSRNQALRAAASQLVPVPSHQVVQRVAEESRDESCQRGEPPGTSEVASHLQRCR